MEVILEFIKGLDLRGFNEAAIVVRFVLAVICGGLIGLEREHKHRPAGFRTHILVCLGAASVMMTSQYLIRTFIMSSGMGSGFVSAVCDPARLGAQVISGIGFVGAGTIMVTKRRQVKGLTTAAGLWDAAIVGLALGAGCYEAGVYATFLVLLVEIVLSKLDWYLIANVRTINVYVEYGTTENLTDIIAKLKDRGARILDIEITKNKLESDVHMSAILSLKLQKKGQNEKILTMLSESDGIRAVEEL